jgi:hypothetical protein
MAGYPRLPAQGCDGQVIYTNTIANGHVVEQRTHWTVDAAYSYAAAINLSGGECKVYVRDTDREDTAYPY